MRPIDTDALVRGQYVGYRDEPGVDPNSNVETFAAVRLEIDSWRWAGVPWYVRVRQGHDSRVPPRRCVELREPPRLLFDEAGGPTPGRNLVRFRLGKNDGVTFTLQAKTPGPAPRQPGRRRRRRLRRRARRAPGGLRAPARRRASPASPRRFARQDVVERTWRVVQPALDDPGAVLPYFRGSWGPADADDILVHGDHWFDPT